MSPEDIECFKPILYELIPLDGKPIGNTNLRRAFESKVKKDFSRTISNDEYWSVRNELLNEGKIKKGMGYGGSVHRVQVTQSIQPPEKSKYKTENDLYAAFHKTVLGSWVKVYNIEDFICQITANQGSKNTGGKWTRPDITLAAVRVYPFIPGKNLEVITFEIKPLYAYGIEGVYETASHSAFANCSYLALHIPKDYDEKDVFERFERECERFGVGFLTFEDPENWDSFNIRIEPVHKTPAPSDLCEFLATQLQKDNQTKIQKLIR